MSCRWRPLLLLGRRLRGVFPPPPPTRGFPWPGQARLWRCSSASGLPPWPGHGAPAGGSSGEEDAEDAELLEAELPLIPLGAREVFVVHPAVKWGPGRPQLTTAELQLAEAFALINTIQNWTVLDTLILSTKTPEKKFIFGKGNFQLLTEKIKGLPRISAVFVNIERLSPLTKKELEEAWGVEVLDRYTVVLHIFRLHARTKEAKLQIALAEIPLLRANVRNEVAQMDQQRGGSRYIMGSGETFMEIHLRLLKEKELKIRKALEKLRRKRQLLRSQRKKREFPTVSVMGYTNCGRGAIQKSFCSCANTCSNSFYTKKVFVLQNFYSWTVIRLKFNEDLLKT